MPELAPRLDVDVARALLEGVLPQPVHHLDDVRVVGVELSCSRCPARPAARSWTARSCRRAALGRALDRLGEVVELDLVALDVRGLAITRRISQLGDALRAPSPTRARTARGRDHHFLAGDADRQDAEARRVGDDITSVTAEKSIFSGSMCRYSRPTRLASHSVSVSSASGLCGGAGALPLLVGDHRRAGAACRGSSGAPSSASRRRLGATMPSSTSQSRSSAIVRRCSATGVSTAAMGGTIMP